MMLPEKRKKVLFIIPSFMKGGMENMLLNISNILVENADITIYNLGSHDQNMMDQLSDQIHYYELWSPCKNILKCDSEDLKNRNFRILPSALWYKAHSGKYVHKKIIHEKFDTEIAFFVGEPIKIVSGNPDRRVNTIMWLHNDYRISGGLYQCFKSKQEAVNAFGTFNHIVCVSKMARESFQKETGISRAEVIYNYLPIEKIRDKSREPCPLKYRKFTIVFVGRLVKAKGVDRLLNVAVRLNREGLDYQIVIVGDGAEKGSLIEYTKKNSLANVIFTGKQENPYPFIAQANLLVCTSRYEGYNLTVAEALILGVPVLSTRCAGPVEILGDGEYGYIVDNNEDAIYSGLWVLITNKDVLEKYRERTRSRFDFFSENKIIEQLEKAIFG